ncbi:hypothetical protein LUZ60_008950 [Juncus effusus]|nr:hypothetical protein LUZ60_008950 [Juncus effusus]
MHSFKTFISNLHQIQEFISKNLSFFSKSNIFRVLRDNIPHLHCQACVKLRSLTTHLKRTYRVILCHSNAFAVQLVYFILISFLSFLSLKLLKFKNPNTKIRDVDLFFTSVSAATLSSMATVEMESFSNSQLWVLIILILLGGEIFTSLLGLHFKRETLNNIKGSKEKSTDSVIIDPENPIVSNLNFDKNVQAREEDILKQKSLKCLSKVVTIYFSTVIISSSAIIFLYICLKSDLRSIIQGRDINIFTLSIFTGISSFLNCGFTPLNDNMSIFSKNPILLLFIIPQILAGNTLYPLFLRFTIWVLKNFTKREEFEFMLKNPKKIGYKHLLSKEESVYMGLTSLGFLAVQMVMFCSLEWNLGDFESLNLIQKSVAFLFQIVNSRHAGESLVGFSSLQPSILVLFMIMMYLPPSTTFLPMKYDKTEKEERENEERNKMEYWNNLMFSPVAYLSIFVIMVCITEMKSISNDPLNFNIFSISFEIISAYGNVGFSVGYNCEKLLKRDNTCVNKSYGFVGKWSDKGKFIIIFIMFIGRLKRHNLQQGNVWKFL